MLLACALDPKYKDDLNNELKDEQKFAANNYLLVYCDAHKDTKRRVKIKRY